MSMIELERKLRQMYAAMSSVISNDMSMVQPVVNANDGYVFVSLDFNKNSDEISLYNNATLLIANIASLKDYLKVWCKRNGKAFNGDNLINSSKSVALIHDLWNTDKHVELTSPRSGHKPKLSNVKTCMRISGGTSDGSGGAFSFDPRTGKLEISTTGDGSVLLVLDSQILDENGNFIADFVQTCEEAVEAWSSELVSVGVPLPNGN